MVMRWNAHSIGWFARPACVLAALCVTPASVAAQAVPTTANPEVTFTKDIAPILQRSCQSCHRPGSRRADVAAHVRRGSSVGAGDEDSNQPARQAGRDAALVPREERGHPAVQGRYLPQQRRDREGCEVGRQRRAARQSRRYAAAAQVPGSGRMEDWNARSDRDLSQFRDEGHRARLVGSDRRDANRPDRGSLRRRGRDEGSQPGGEEIGSADDRRPLHLPPSDLGCDRRRGRPGATF